MKYGLTSDLILFRPVMKVKYISNFKTALYFNHMGWFLICQWMWGLGVLSDMIGWERSYWFSSPGRFFVGFCFCWNFFSHKNKSTAHSLFSTSIDKLSHNPSTPWYHLLKTLRRGWMRRRGSRRDWGGFCCKCKGCRDGVEHKVGKNQ